MTAAAASSRTIVPTGAAAHAAVALVGSCKYSQKGALCSAAAAVAAAGVLMLQESPTTALAQAPAGMPTSGNTGPRD
jgi:hypothetical protein